jgi:2-pyrone-4,6-dicarboxylate lactonase
MKFPPPPHPNPSKPKFTPPPGACDTHVHVFGPRDRFPYHPKTTYTPVDAPKEKLRALQGLLGFDRTVIVQATCHGTDNAATLDAIATSNGRWKGVAIVDESFTEKDFEELDAGGIKGIRFSFARHLSGPPNFDRVHRIAEKIAGLGWHLVIYIEAEDIVDFADDLKKFRLPIVFDHMIRVKVEDGLDSKPFRLLLDFMRNEDVWVKISCAERLSKSGPPFHDVIPFAQAVIETRPDRALWGTDWPHPNLWTAMPDEGALVDLLPLYAPDEAVRHKLLVENPAKLYGFVG